MPLVPRFQKTIFALADRFRFDMLQNAIGLPLKDNTFSFLDRTDTDGMDDWTFRQVTPHRTDGQHGFIFTATLTNLQRNRPVLRFPDEDEQPWSPELEDLLLINNPNFPIYIPYFDQVSGQTGQARRPSVMKQDSYRGPETYLSPVLVEIFISDRPWPKSAHPTPQGTPVNWSFGASHGDYGSCLHDDITIPAQSLQYEVLLKDGTSGIVVGSGALSEQEFPATNMKRRQPFVRMNKVQQFQALWMKRRETVFPLKLSELSTLTSS